MQKVFLLITLVVIPFVNCISQTIPDSTNFISEKDIKGRMLDIDKQTPLPYANIFVMHTNTGAISNETGLL